MIPLRSAIPERIRDGLQRCAIEIDVYFTLRERTAIFTGIGWSPDPTTEKRISAQWRLDLEIFSSRRVLDPILLPNNFSTQTYDNEHVRNIN